jgi:hypothetical protein
MVIQERVATMKMTKLKALLAAVSMSAAGSVLASPVITWEVDVFTRFDTATVLPAGVTIVNNQSLRWGTPVGAGTQSGLDITASPSVTFVDTNGPAVANVSVTHFNQPITGTTLTSVNILSTLTLTPSNPPDPDAVGPATITFAIRFAETTNQPGGGICADGTPNNVGLNVNGCADIFVIDQAALNFPFLYEDPDDPGVFRQYFISFFELTGGLNPLPALACTATGSPVPCLGFRTPEQANTTFQFAALITTERVRIPEPGALALLGIALGAMAIGRRRRAA